MRFTLLPFITATFCFGFVQVAALNHAVQSHRSMDQCTLSACGKDDAPQFMRAVQECRTVTIPKDTTLNIETRLNMTGLQNKHIVSS